MRHLRSHCKIESPMDLRLPVPRGAGQVPLGGIQNSRAKDRPNSPDVVGSDARECWVEDQFGTAFVSPRTRVRRSRQEQKFPLFVAEPTPVSVSPNA